MKLVKLSLVAALAASSISVLEAKPLEEAIKNVDVSGMMRYRFEQSSPSKESYTNIGGYIGETNAPHKFRAFVGAKIDAGDGFKLFGQLMYNNDKNGGWYKDGSDDPALTTTKQEVVLKQAYLQYDLADAGVSVIFGKQQLGTIWTADFTGMAAKVLITPTQGLTIAAFGVDSFEGSTGDGDAFNPGNATMPADNEFTDENNAQLTGQALKDAKAAYRKEADGAIYNNNMYGAAVLANFAGLDAQVWGAYWDRIATLYAVNLKYTLGLGGGNNAGVKVTYLGNSMDSDLKDSFANGNLVDGRLFAKFSGLDARVGGIFFGDKKKATINTLEDITGPDLYIGREMFYADSTALVQSAGQSTYGYVGVGYTLPMDLRVGVQGVFGQTKFEGDFKDTKIEGVFELGYKVNKNLSFEGYYSYLNSKQKNGGYGKFGADGKVDDTAEPSDSQNKQTVRLQALYKF